MIGKIAIGTVLRDRYKLIDVVGHGGMGNVYLAEDLRLPGRMCAIKEIQPEANASPEAQRQEHNQFLREASLLAQLDHPNLPKVSDFFAEGGRDYLVGVCTDFSGGFLYRLSIVAYTLCELCYFACTLSYKLS